MVEEQKRRKLYSLTPLGERKTREFVQSYKRHVGQIMDFMDGNLRCARAARDILSPDRLTGGSKVDLGSSRLGGLVPPE